MRSASGSSGEEFWNFLEGSSQCTALPAPKTGRLPMTSCLHTGPKGVMQVSPSQAPNTVELVFFFSRSLTLISAVPCHLAGLLGRAVTKGRVLWRFRSFSHRNAVSLRSHELNGKSPTLQSLTWFPLTSSGWDVGGCHSK